MQLQTSTFLMITLARYLPSFGGNYCLPEDGGNRCSEILASIHQTTHESTLAILQYSDWQWAGWWSGQGLSPGRIKNDLLCTSSWPALVPTRPPIQWLLVDFPLGIKGLACEAHLWRPSNAKVKEMWTTSTTFIRSNSWSSTTAAQSNVAFHGHISIV
jgi:hypothetical protein